MYAVLGVLLIVLLLFVGVYFTISSRPPKKNTAVSISPSLVFTSVPPLATATPYPSIIQQKQIEQQKSSDIDWAQQAQKTTEQYPWLDKLPLKTDSYFVYFDTEKKQFIGKVYAKESAVPEIKNIVISKLKELQINTDSYPFEWQTYAQ